MPYKVKEVEHARQLYKTGQSQEAIDYLNAHYLSENPDCYKGLHLKGMALMALKRYAESAAIYEQILTTQKRYAFYSNLAQSYFHLENFEAAKQALLSAKALEPNHAENDFLLYRIEKQLNQPEDALKALQQAHYKNPENKLYLSRLCSECLNLKRYDLGITYLKLVIKTTQNHNPKIYTHIADGYRLLKKPEKSIKWYKKALDGFATTQTTISETALSEIHIHYSLMQLEIGNFKEGMKYFNVRLNNPAYNNYSATNNAYQTLIDKVPQWQGESLTGKVLFIISEQGIGDVIQFSRFFKQIPKTEGTQIIFLGSKILIKAIKHLYEGAETIDIMSARLSFSEQTVLDGNGVFYIHLYDLLSALKVEPKNLNGKPYFNYPTKPNPSLDLPYSNKVLKIGFVWKGNSGHGNDANRSMSLEDFFPLLDIENAKLISLQKSPEVEAGQLTSYRSFIDDYGRKCNSLAATAYVINQLDCVVTVDTSVAHLAGALGKRVYVLLPNQRHDWRWGKYNENNTTPWYDSMRLVWKQNGTWDSSILKVAKMIEKEIKKHTHIKGN